MSLGILRVSSVVGFLSLLPFALGAEHALKRLEEVDQRDSDTMKTAMQATPAIKFNITNFFACLTYL